MLKEGVRHVRSIWWLYTLGSRVPYYLRSLLPARSGLHDNDLHNNPSCVKQEDENGAVVLEECQVHLGTLFRAFESGASSWNEHPTRTLKMETESVAGFPCCFLVEVTA